MTMREFLREYAGRDRQDDHGGGVQVRRQRGRGTPPTPAPRYTDKERRLWIANHEGLYNWARSEGVRV